MRVPLRLIERADGLHSSTGVRAAVEAHSGELYGFAYRALGDQGLAEEVVQETFVRAWRAGRRFDPNIASLRSWLFAILRNVIIDASRARSVRPGVSVVVDVAVALTDGQYHTVDSSDQAFKTAGRMAMSEGMPKCDPVLLEPIHQVTIAVPNEFTARVHGLISGRRGQFQGFSAKEGWAGWDEVQALLPQSELHDLIVELRSLTLGVGTFAWRGQRLFTPC